MMTKFNQSEFSEAFRSFSTDSALNPTQSMLIGKDFPSANQCSANVPNPNIENHTTFNLSDAQMFHRFGVNASAMHHVPPSQQTSTEMMHRSKDHHQDLHHQQRSGAAHLMLAQKNVQSSQNGDNSFSHPDNHNPLNEELHHHQQQHVLDYNHPQSHSPDSASLTDYDESSSLSSEEHVLTPLACAAAGQSRPCLTWACKACKKKSVAVDRRKAATLRERRRLRKVSAN